ncbi:hypothetical protein ABNavy71_025 [Acinetobacter phage AB-Navy71]|nr:hypothetical protein ABNavy71_025 [Acinetobacter phage AB-Navy71]
MKWHPSIPHTIRCAFLAAIVALLLTAIIVVPLLPESVPLSLYSIIVVVVLACLLCIDENSEL